MIIAPVEPTSALPDSNYAVAQVLLGGVPLCAYVKDLEGVYRAANAPFRDWLSQPTTAIVGHTDAELWPAYLARRYSEDDSRALNGLRLEKDESRLRGSGLLQVRSIRQPLFDASGRVNGLLGLFWEAQPPADEEARRQSQRLELAGRLVGGVVHDFNNLLAALQVGLGLLGEATQAQGSPDDVLPVLLQATEQAGRLTEQLLGFLRRRGPVREPVDLRRTAREVLAILSCTLDPAIAVEARLEEAVPLVQGDPGALAQVLFNLCLNACDAMPHGGQLRIETEPVSQPLPAAGNRLGRFVRLRVTDTGEGIPPEVSQHIFDPFFTTKPPGQGSGLGLSIVGDIVREHRGVVECASQVGLGTQFNVLLPAQDESAEPLPEDKPVPAPSPVPAASGHTLLLADNEPAIRFLVRMVLQKNGYRVLLAENGREAVDIYRQNRGAVDLVLLDRRMPVLSGEAAAAEMAALDPAVRVLLLSGQVTDAVPENLAGTVRGVLAKPFKAEQIVQAVRAILE
jgi:two-component system cell cycle sensor histidine kinase/response regulator CckA